MSTGGNEDFHKEIREIMYDRITAVSEKLHRNGMRWSDMFSEEDTRAIETYKIETVGETEQEAAERETRRRDTEKRRIEAAMKLRALALAKSKTESVQRNSIIEKKTLWKKTECDESEQVPEDPNPPPIFARKWFDKGKVVAHDEEPCSSKMGSFQRENNCSRWYRKNDSADIKRQLLFHRRNYVWRDSRMNRTLESNNWHRSNVENNAQSGFRRPYHVYGDQGSRRFLSRPRWYSNAYNRHALEQDNQKEHAHCSSSGEIINSHQRYENFRPSWRKSQSSTRSFHH